MRDKHGSTALLAVDVQPDFMPGGALAVLCGDEVVEPLLAAARHADLVVATRDWHPPHHVSFVERGGPWPPHCVATTPGAAIVPDIDRIADVIVSKGTDPDVDAYSGFDGTSLAAMLRARGVSRVLVGGLATDYCVRATALDALRAGFMAVVVVDAVRAVEVEAGDGARALTEMGDAGARLLEVSRLGEVRASAGR